MPAETEDQLEASLIELFRPSQAMTTADCQPGRLYWVGASFGPVAICTETGPNSASFLGVTESMGNYSLQTQYYFDDGSITHNTVLPFSELGPAPIHLGDTEQRRWLLTQDVDFIQKRLATLNDSTQYQSLPLWQEKIEAETQELANLQRALNET
jgi:hypothetical protein